MVTPTVIEPFLSKWLDVAILSPETSIIKQPTIVLIFDNKEIGDEFLKLLRANDFGFAAENSDGYYDFSIEFIGTESTILRKSDTPSDNYPLMKWHKEGYGFMITIGVWIDRSPMVRSFDYGKSVIIPVSKIFFTE
jgi:hypothetical protein